MLLTFAASLTVIQAPARIEFADGLCITTPAGRRSAIRLDPVDYELVTGTWHQPKEGETVGTAKWTKATVTKEGRFDGAATRGGYFYFKVESATERVMLLAASANGMVYVNGEPRVGDVYGLGYVTLPVRLKKGANDFLFSSGRGALQASLIVPKKPIFFDTRDATLPDVTPDNLSKPKEKISGALIVSNATIKDLSNVALEAVTDSGRITTPVVSILETTNRKVGFDMYPPSDGKVIVRLLVGGKEVDRTDFTLRVRKAGETYKQTFWSKVDSSVQYYGVNPSSKPNAGQALFLSLHGASVEGLGQAEAYSPKSWGTIAAATNRRPYGFDWEDIGRLDALEVLADAKARFKTDPSKTYLMGHSMGGHGTWQIGAHFPDQFAAIMPSAGWISFNTYAGGVKYTNPTPVEEILTRGANPSETLLLKNNYKQEAVYILHGDADDNVPVDQARQMRKELSEFHHDFDWWEQPGANHWWDASPEPGADCVDWAPGFDLFGRRRIPSSDQVRLIDFTTIAPGINANCHWVSVQRQVHAFQPSRVQLRLDPLSKKLTGKTENVETLSVRPRVEAGPIAFDLDGQTFSVSPTSKEITLRRSATGWEVSRNLGLEKNPAQSGGFKSVFNHQFVLVYGTLGSASEIAWARAKAKFDAETLWYRGNGSVDIISDVELLKRRMPERNVVLYGNRQTNAAWNSVLDDSDFAPTIAGLSADQAVIAVRPRKGSRVASVGIVGGNGLPALRLTNRASYFQSGAGYPDCLILNPATLKTGTKGVVAAGFFGNDWSVKNGDFAWQK